MEGNRVWYRSGIANTKRRFRFLNGHVHYIKYLKRKKNGIIALIQRSKNTMKSSKKTLIESHNNRWLIAWLFWWQFVSSLAWVLLAVVRSLRSDTYVRMQHFVRRTTYVPFRRFWGDVRREFMQRLSAALHGTMGSYLRDALQEISPRRVGMPSCSSGLRFLLFFFFFGWWSPLLFLVRFILRSECR
jgi:hypothetical protein